MRFLLASRSSCVSDNLKLQKTADLINAAKENFVDTFGDDYGLLSDMAHPNTSAAFGLALIEESATIAVHRRPPLNELQAKVLLKVWSLDSTLLLTTAS